MPKDNLIVDSPSQCTGYTKTFWVLELVVRYFIVAQTAVPNLIKNLTTTKDPTCSFINPPGAMGAEESKGGGEESSKTRTARFSCFTFVAPCCCLCRRHIYFVFVYVFIVCLSARI